MPQPMSSIPIIMPMPIMLHIALGSTVGDGFVADCGVGIGVMPGMLPPAPAVAAPGLAGEVSMQAGLKSACTGTPMRPSV